MTKSNQHDGYVSYDLPESTHWLRMYCAPVAELGCGLVLFQQNYKHFNDYFDHATEANIGIVAAGSLQAGIEMINNGRAHIGHNPTVIRRINRLLTHGDLSTQIGNTLTERGLDAAIVYAVEGDTHKKYKMFERAGWEKDTRADKNVFILRV